MQRTRRNTSIVALISLLLLSCQTTATKETPSSSAARSPAPQTALVTATAAATLKVQPTNATASDSPEATPAPPLPEALRYRWVGETRSIPGAVPPVVESWMTVDPDQLTFYATEDGRHPLAISTASADAAGNVLLTFQSGTAPCTEGDEGVYRFELTDTQRSLNVIAIEDACGQRIDAISGSWTRSACPTNHLCLGDLDTGHHVSVIYTPFVQFADWHYNYGRFGYTVPDGWITDEDDQDGYVLVPGRGPVGAGVYVFSDVLAHDQQRDPQTKHCVGAAAPSVGSSAAAIHDWITKLDGLSVAGDQEVQIGGLRGYALDVAVDPTWTRTCGFADEAPGVPLFVNAQTTPEEGFDWGISGDIRMRLFVLSVAEPDSDQAGRTLLIDIEAPDKATWDALLTEATPIVDSFEFSK
jgi:hypothetical protein